MRIVQVITRPQRRGAEIFATQLSEHLLQAGHEVILISLFPSSQELSFSGKFIRMNLLYRGKLDVRAFRLFAKELKDFDPDIVQANASETLRMCVGSRFFYKGSYQLIYRNANQMSGLLKSNLHKSWNQWLLSKVDGIISVSEASKKDLIHTFSPKKPIEVIPIGIDSEQIQKSLELEKVDLPFSYLIQIGGLVPEKDPLGMLAIFLKIENKDLNLIYLGSGPFESSLRDKINELNLGHRVLLIPNQVNIFPYLKKAKALVMPSKVEGLPGVILEAMFCRIPVVVYAVGGIPEVLKNKETGWCVPPNNPKAFVHAIQEVLKMDESSKKQILNQAHNLVLAHYSLPEVTRQFEDFYNNLLSQN